MTLELWSDPENDGEQSCCSAQAVRGARALAHRLGMPHLSIDLRAEFRAGVVDGWISGHAAGLTPNPCISCNGNVRLDAMLDLGRRLGAETLATGHYARVDERSPVPLLRTAADTAKDQSYVLSGLAPASLRRLRFPLGELEKPQVRALAERAGLAVAGRRDSQDLCFLAGTRRDAFLERHGGLRPAPGADSHAPGGGARRALRRPPLHGRPAPRPRYRGGAAPVRALDRRPHQHRHRRAALGAAGLAHRGARDRPSSPQPRRRRRPGARPWPANALPGRTASSAPAATARAGIELLHEAERTAPGQLACLYAGELVVGHATIAA